MKRVKIYPHLKGGGNRHRRLTKYKTKPQHKDAYYCDYCSHWHLYVSPKKVYQFDKSHNLITIHESTTAASRATGVDRKNIRRNCNGGTKTAGGFIWSYKNHLKKLRDFKPGERFLYKLKTCIRVNAPEKDGEVMIVDINNGDWILCRSSEKVSSI